MELIYTHRLTGSVYESQVLALLQQADGEFIPPLSARGSTTQQNLESAQTLPTGIGDYFSAMGQQPAILAIHEGNCLGFMSFKIDYSCPHSPPFPNLYASTCVVAPAARGQGLMKGFYRKMGELYPDHAIFTRTWHTNYAHIRTLEGLGFSLCARLPDHRGPGLDTVYYTNK